MAKIKQTNKDEGQLELSYITDGKCKMVQLFSKTAEQSFIQLNIYLLYNLAILLLAVYPNVVKM